MKPDDCSNIFIFIIILSVESFVYSGQTQERDVLIREHPRLFCVLRNVTAELLKTPEGVVCAQQKLGALRGEIQMIEREPSSPTRLRKLQERALHSTVLHENLHKKQAIQSEQEG